MIFLFFMVIFVTFNGKKNSFFCISPQKILTLHFICKS